MLKNIGIFVFFGLFISLAGCNLSQESVKKTLGTFMKKEVFEQKTYPYSLPQLPYKYEALEPHFDEMTMNIHHTKHHQAYVNNLNATIEKFPELHKKTLVDLLVNLQTLPTDVQDAIKNHGGGHFNHSLFWEWLSPNGGGLPKEKLATAIDECFGSFDNFKQLFNKSAQSRFGSGWAWLCVTTDKKLIVTSSLNQDSPLSQGLIPVLGLDVWEHAYYLKYQNRRPDYIAAWWNIINWQVVEDYFIKAIEA